MRADVDVEDRARRKAKAEAILGVGSGMGADEDDFMAVSREDLGRAGSESKGKRKKHPPAKNGERPGMAKQYKQAAEGSQEDSPILPKQEVNLEAQEARPRPTGRVGLQKAKIVKF